jgi:leader peptidase (prepilin peptidase)/N-methyltransferase
VSFIAPLSGALLGAIIGSFLATLIIRWPRNEQALLGRSRCDSCGRELRWWELVPLASRVALSGRCSACGAAIDPLHGRIELAAAAVGAVALAISPDLGGVSLALFGWLLLPLAILDLRHMWLPDPLTALLAAVGLLLGSQLGITLADRLLGGAAGWASLWLIALAYRRIRGREGLGQGDAKLMGAIGCWLGWMALPVVLLAGAALGLGIAVAKGMRRTDALPFGAMLAAGGWLTLVALVARYAEGAASI